MHPRFHLFTKTLLTLTTRLHHLFFFFFLTVEAEAEVEVEEAHQTFLPLNENPIKTPLSIFLKQALKNSLSLSLLTSFSLQKQGRKEKKKRERKKPKKKKQVLKTQKTLF